MSDGKIHEWFGLSYASYLVLPRSILQSTPQEWQDKFVDLLEELEEMGFKCPEEGKTYSVNARDDKTGRFTTDIFQEYERGRRMIIPADLEEMLDEKPSH